MSDNYDWQISAQQELQQAEAARAIDNEGMARVCARRATGIIIGEYLTRRGLSSPGPSAYDRLRFFCSLPDLSSEIQDTAGHFLLRITPDHTLPIDVDLIAEARWLMQELLGT